MIKKVLIISALMITMTGCSLFKKSATKGATLKVDKDAKLITSKNTIDVQAQKEINLPKESFLVRSEGSLPVYVIPVNNEYETTELSLIPVNKGEVESAYKDILKEEVSKSLFTVHEIQNEIFTKNYNKALRLIEEAEVKYGDVSYLLYMKASVFYLQGKKSKAKRTLISLGEEVKKNKKIQEFLKELE